MERKCFHCGAPQKWSERKQKWYCSELCWNKNKPQDGSQTSEPHPSTTEPQKPHGGANRGQYGASTESLASSVMGLLTEVSLLNAKVDEIHAMLKLGTNPPYKDTRNSKVGTQYPLPGDIKGEPPF